MYLVSSNQHMLLLFKELAGGRGLGTSWEVVDDAAAASDADFMVSCAATGSERPLDPGEASQRKMLTAKGTDDHQGAPAGRVSSLLVCVL